MDPIAVTTAGKVRGRWAGDTALFLGLPYAAPPVGENRFGPPRRHKPWEETRDAGTFGPTAPQAVQEFSLIPEPVITGDDVLNLNVFTPDPGFAGLPVLVWIHGGGFFSGCSANPWYRGERFARDGVVAVSINYRLGLEGFLALQDEGGNRAVLDWVAALEWVRENIAAFGGDPANVTIAGQSAGATACEVLMTNPNAEGLFHRAICMSGPGGLVATAVQAAALARIASEQLGFPLTRQSLSDLSDERLAELRAIFTPGTAAITNAAGGPGSSETPGTGAAPSAAPLIPYVDGEVIPTDPMHALESGAGSSIDLLAGATTQELNMFFSGAMADTDMDDASLHDALAGMGLTSAAALAYREAQPAATNLTVLGQALTDRMFRIHATHLGSARHHAEARTFLYQWAWRSPGRDGAVGAAHCIDIPFAFDNLDAPGGENALGADPPRDLADVTHRAWTNFVTTGDPGWPQYTIDDRRTMVFDEKSRVVDDPMRAERRLWGA